MAKGAQYGRRKKVEMIESALFLAVAGILAMMLASGLLARRPASAQATLRIRKTKP